MKLELEAEKSELSDGYGGCDWVYAPTLEAMVVDTLILGRGVQLELSITDSDFERLKNDETEEKCVSFMLSKRQAEVLGRFLIGCAKNMTD